MEQKSKFDKVMGAWDILVIAFGAMIGWGWVINSGVDHNRRFCRIYDCHADRWSDGIFCRTYLCGTDFCNAAVRW